MSDDCASKAAYSNLCSSVEPLVSLSGHFCGNHLSCKSEGAVQLYTAALYTGLCLQCESLYVVLYVLT